MELDKQALDNWIMREPPEGDADAYEAWCEQNDFDPSDDHWEAFYEYVEGGREEADERRAEERAEREADYEWE